MHNCESQDTVKSRHQQKRYRPLDIPKVSDPPHNFAGGTGISCSNPHRSADPIAEGQHDTCTPEELSDLGDKALTFRYTS